MNAGDRVTMQGMEGNYAERLETAEREIADLKATVLNLSQADHLTSDLGTQNVDELFTEIVHANADMVDINWWLPINLASDNVTSIRAVVYDGTEYIYVAGQFLTIGGQSCPTGYGVARYSLATRNWQVIGKMNGMVYALTFFGSTLYAGGAFTAINGTGGYNRFARFTSTWGSPLGNGCTGGDVLALDADGSYVYLTGSFTSADSVANTNKVARFNGTVYSAMGTGLTGTDGQAVVVAGTDVWVGGNYTSAGGVSNTAYIAKWNGSVWVSVGIFNGQVKALAYDADGGAVYAGGAFTTIDSVNFTRVAKNSGGSWETMSDGLNSDVYVLQVDGDGNVIAGGAFTDAGGDVLADRVARFADNIFESISNAGGASGLDGIVYALLILSNGSIAAGGSFNFAGSIQCQSIAVYCKPLSDAIDIIASLFELYSPSEGTYTPTITNTTNVAANTPRLTSYFRIGLMVTVFGGIDIDPTTAGINTAFEMSLPIVSDLANTFELAGTGSVATNRDGVRISGVVANNTAIFGCTPTDGTNREWSFHFSYRII